MKKTILATVDVTGNQSNNDALRYWLKGNGYEWEYDHFGRLRFKLRDGWYRAEFKWITRLDALRIYAIPEQQ